MTKLYKPDFSCLIFHENFLLIWGMAGVSVELGEFKSCFRIALQAAKDEITSIVNVEKISKAQVLPSFDFMIGTHPGLLRWNGCGFLPLGPCLDNMPNCWQVF